MEAILDTNFIISCTMKGIDFILQLEEKGFKIKVPKEVIEELKDLRFHKGQSHDEKIAIEIALELITRKKIKKINLGHGKVDEALIKKGKEGVYIATLDREIKRQVKNRIVISNAKNEVVVERE